MEKSNTVFTSANPIEAQIVKGVLETQGIEVFLLDENINRIHPFYSVAVGGVKVVVPPHQLEEARDILKDWSQTAEGEKLSGQFSPFEFIGKDPRPRSWLLTAFLALVLSPIAVLAWLGLVQSRRK